jgi:hypothetical protein
MVASGRLMFAELLPGECVPKQPSDGHLPAQKR